MPDVGFHGIENASVVPQVPQDVEASRGAPNEKVDTGFTLEIENEMYQGQHDQIDIFPFEDHGQNHDIGNQGGGGYLHNKSQRTKRETQRRTLKLIIDENTMLTREEMIEQRDNYQLNQALLIREHDLKQATLAARSCMESLLSRPLSVSNCGSDLTAFWSSAGARSINTLSSVPQAVAATQDQRVIQNDNHLFIDVEQPYEFEIEPPEPEVRRRQASPDAGDTPIDMSISGGGVDNIGNNEKLGGHMPWSMDFRTSVDSRSEHSSGGSDHLRRDFETIFDPASGRPVKRQRKHSGTGGSSLDLQEPENEPMTIHRRHLTPLGNHSGSQSRYSSHQGSHHGSRQCSRATSRQRGDGGGPESSMDAHDLFMTDLSTGELTATQEHVAFDRETINFLEYVRSILREANATSFSFSDVISVHGRRDVAASAFYHVLGRTYPSDIVC